MYSYPQFLLSSFCEFIHDGYCLATLARFVHQACAWKGNFNLFSTFLTRNEGTTVEPKKRLGCFQQEQLNLPPEYSVFDSSQCIVNNRKLKMWRRRKSQISNSVTKQNNNFARASHFFFTFLRRRLHDYPWKCLISCFVKDVNKQWQNSFFSCTWIWLIEIQLQKSSLAWLHLTK